MSNQMAVVQRFFVLYGLLIALTVFQVAFWDSTNEIIPDMEIVPDLPSETEAKILALGDDHFFFRWQAFNLQNAGWTYGRNTPLDQFDYRKLYFWFKMMDTYDDESNFIPTLASYYYSRTTRVDDLKFLVHYLYEYSRYRLEQKWFWQVEAVHIADHKMNDRDLALQMALPLLQLHNVPIIIRELPAFIYERRGEMDKAREIIEEIKGDTVLPKGELNFMTYFLEDRLKKHNAKTLYFNERTSSSGKTK